MRVRRVLEWRIAGTFYCFLWRRSTSSSCVCVLRPRCAVLDLSSVLKHMWQTTVGSVYQPLKTQGIADAFFFFFFCLLIVILGHITHQSHQW